MQLGLCANLDMASSFLDLLYTGLEGEQIEFRCLKMNTPPLVRTVNLPVSKEILEGLDRSNNEGYNVYYGVATRQNRRAFKFPALWVDIDYKHHPVTLLSPGFSIKLSLLSSDIKPSVIVESGNGIHAYWLINQTEDHSVVKDLNKRLALKFGGDHCHDPQRILRLPGFYNVKNPARPLLCKVSNDAVNGIMRYDVDDLSAWLSDIDVPTMGEKLEALVKYGNQGQYQSRSEADFACVMGLVKAGYSDDDIFELYDDPENNIGERYRERGAYSSQYLQTTIDNARRRVA